MNYLLRYQIFKMKKLRIEKAKKSNDTITRTIRISGKTFDKINELAEKNELSTWICSDQIDMAAQMVGTFSKNRIFFLFLI